MPKTLMKYSSLPYVIFSKVMKYFYFNKIQLNVMLLLHVTCAFKIITSKLEGSEYSIDLNLCGIVERELKKHVCQK